MNAPRSVQRQADEANRIQKELIDKKAGKPVVSEVDPPAPTIVVDQGNWEERFKGMQKTHETAIGLWRDEKTVLVGRIDAFEALLKDAPDTVVPAAQVPVFTEKEVEEYGQDFLDMVTRVATQTSPGNSGVIAKELAELKNQFSGLVNRQVKSSEDQFFADLDRRMPDWEQVNKSDEFKAWLAELMPLTGKQRQVFLEDAYKRFDVEAVLSFFTSWKGESGVSYMADTVTIADNTGEGSDGVDTDIYYEHEITRFYDDKKLGKWKGREKEFRQIELKILKAGKDGRIRKR